MNNEFKIDRRNLLKSAAASGAVLLSSNAMGARGDIPTTETGFGPVRLVELGVEYRLQEQHNYHGTIVDGDPLYFVDPNDDRMILTSSVGDEAETVKNNDAIIGSYGLNSPPATVHSADPTRTITTVVKNSRRPVRNVHLTEPFTPPAVEVRETGTSLTVVADGDHHEITPGTATELELEAREVVAETFHVTDEIGTIEGAPEEELGPKTEYNSVQVGATPVVKVKDHGMLTVERLETP